MWFLPSHLLLKNLTYLTFFVALPVLSPLSSSYPSLHLISRSADLQSPIMLRISFLQLLFVTLLALSAVFAVDAVPGTSQRESLQEAPADIKVASLHDALHALSAKFRHGIFPTDLDAAEALQGEEPNIASLIKLAKRQDNATASSAPASIVTTANTESTTDPATTSAAETSATSEPTSAPSSTESTTTIQPTVTSASSTSEPTTSSSSSVSVPTETSSTVSTQTTAQPTTATTASSTTQTTHSETTSVPSTLSTTKSTSSSSSTSTTSNQSTTSAHTTENTSLSTSTFKSTTTMPDGSLSTITSITVITPSATGKASEATTAGKPGLQTGNAAAMVTGIGREVVAMVGGAVVVAMAL